MKKLSFAIVLFVAGASFVNAQSREVQKKNAAGKAPTTEINVEKSNVDTYPNTNTDAVRTEELQSKARTEVMTEAQIEPADARVDPAVEQQKALIKKEEMRKAETK